MLTVAAPARFQAVAPVSFFVFDKSRSPRPSATEPGGRRQLTAPAAQGP